MNEAERLPPKAGAEQDDEYTGIDWPFWIVFTLIVACLFWSCTTYGCRA